MSSHSVFQKVFLHAAFLAAANLFTGVFIFAIAIIFDFKFDPSLYWIIALLLTVSLYYLIFVIARNADFDIMVLPNLWVLFAVLAASLVLAPILFHAIHLMTNKSMWNWEYAKKAIPHQVLVNAVCLALNFFILGTTKIKDK